MIPMHEFGWMLGAAIALGISIPKLSLSHVGFAFKCVGVFICAVPVILFCGAGLYGFWLLGLAILSRIMN